MKQWSLCLLICCLFFASCKKDKKECPIPETPGITLIFKGLFNGEPLILNNEYTYSNGNKLRISQLEFYISDVRLVKNGVETPILDVGLLDFSVSHNEECSAKAGEYIEIANIPDDTYDEIRFGIGVSPTLNATVPEDYLATHPLGRSVNHWSAWNSYIFAKVEGRSDEDGNGEFENNIVYHTGNDIMYREKSISTTITTKSGTHTPISMVVDVLDLLSDGGNSIDLGISHSSPLDSAAVETAVFIMDNFDTALRLE